MTMLENHREAREKKVNNVKNVLHEFRLKYKKDKKMIYGFVEGKDDPCFYRGFIENKLEQPWKVELWCAGGKDNVLAIHSKLEWQDFNKKQVVFFIDRDLSEFTGDKVSDEENIYVTDKYSIENDIVNRNTCDRVLTELCGFNELETDKKEKLLDLFEEQMDIFFQSMIPIMAWIIHCRRKEEKANLDDIYMKHLFKFNKGKIKLNPKPTGKNSVTDYIHKQCNLEIDPSYKASQAEAEFSVENKHKKYTRGKYLMWFLVEFCLSIYKDYEQMGLSGKNPKMVINLSQSNGIALIAPRCRAPKSLNLFLEQTICRYVEMRETA